MTHTAEVRELKGRQQWEGKCSCGWMAIGVAGPNTEAMIRANLDLHLSRIRPKDRV